MPFIHSYKLGFSLKRRSRHNSNYFFYVITEFISLLSAKYFLTWTPLTPNPEPSTGQFCRFPWGSSATTTDKVTDCVSAVPSTWWTITGQDGNQTALHPCYSVRGEKQPSNYSLPTSMVFLQVKHCLVPHLLEEPGISQQFFSVWDYMADHFLPPQLLLLLYLHLLPETLLGGKNIFRTLPLHVRATFILKN